MTEAEFREVYRGTPVTRAKRRGLAKNAAVALGNTGDRANAQALAETLETHDEPLARGHAAWALGHLGGRIARQALERRRNLDPDESVNAEILAALEQPKARAAGRSGIDSNCEGRRLRLGRLAHRAHAARADVDAKGHAVERQPSFVHIRLERAVCSAL